MWLVRSWSSTPCFTSRCARAMIPALATMPRSSPARSRTLATAARTLAGSERSQATGTTSAPTAWAAARARSSVRASPITVAPRRWSTRSVSWPSPEPTPVTTKVRPWRSTPSLTSSAVDA